MNDLMCEDGTSIKTAIGCISGNTVLGLVDNLLPWFFGIAGGAAFVLIVYGGFLITTSGGDPKKLSAGKELMTAAISGVVFLALSVFILKLLGKDILNIPGL